MVIVCFSSFGEGGTFDCDTVIQSVTVLGLKRKPSTVLLHVSGENAHRTMFLIKKNVKVNGKMEQQYVKKN